MSSTNPNHPATVGATTHDGRRGQEPKAETRARASLKPTVQAALTLHDYNGQFGELSINTLVDQLATLNALSPKENLAHAEALLLMQAQTLDAIFHKLARDASKSSNMAALEAQLRLALKAQSQCRATVEALAAIKNPRPVAFVQQANIANGPQQVNNSIAARQVVSDAPVAIEGAQNKLLEGQHGERVDPGTASTAGHANSRLETLVPIHRAEDSSR